MTKRQFGCEGSSETVEEDTYGRDFSVALGGCYDGRLIFEVVVIQAESLNSILKKNVLLGSPAYSSETAFHSISKPADYLAFPFSLSTVRWQVYDRC